MIEISKTNSFKARKYAESRSTLKYPEILPFLYHSNLNRSRQRRRKTQRRQSSSKTSVNFCFSKRSRRIRRSLRSTRRNAKAHRSGCKKAKKNLRSRLKRTGSSGMNVRRSWQLSRIRHQRKRCCKISSMISRRFCSSRTLIRRIRG